jgi:hypothetical protein
MQVPLYLFDFKIYKDKDLILFGYLERENCWQKVEVLVEHFDITL